MKIILVPNNQTMAARHYCVVKELQAQGHEVTYFMWQHPFGLSLKELARHAVTSLIPKKYRHETFTVHKAIRLPFFWPIINGWIFKAQLRALYKKIGADLIIAESYTNETEIPKDLPFVYDLADDYAGPAESYGSTIYKLAFKLLDVRGVMQRHCKNALAVTAVSSTLYDYARGLNTNTTLAPNGVESVLIQNVLSQKHRVKRHSIVYATGFGPWSRAVETLETVTKLRKDFPDISLTLIGSGTEVPKIKQYIEDHDAHDYISYIDYVYDRQELYTRLSKHAIGLNISDKNSWRDASHPMKVMDYSALGMKVVSTNLKEVEKLGYENIYMFSDTNKRRSFYTVLRQALKDKPKSYKKVSQQVLSKYDWPVITGSIIDVSERALAEKAAKDAAQKHRIVHVSYAYPPAVGGLEQVAQQLATAQAAEGMQVSVITSDKGLKGSAHLNDTIPVTRLKSFVVANTTIMPSLFGKLLRLNASGTVHLHVAQAFSPEIVWLASKIRGFRYVAHVHLDIPPSGWAGFLLRIYKPFVLGKVLRHAHAVAVFTEDQKATISQQYHIEPSKVHVIPNGVADQYFISKKRSLHKKPRLLFVGRLSYQKNIAQLLDALDGISDQFETTIIGDGELKQQLQAQAKKLKLKNVKFAGFATGEKLLSYYKQADIFVLPSEREGMPLVLLEAMAAGLPTIATEVTGNKDVIKHNKNGLLVPYGNATALRKALTKLAADKPLYQKMSRAAATMAQSFTWTAVREQFANIYPRHDAVKEVAKQPAGPHTHALPAVILPLLAVAVLAYALPGILGSIITLAFFLTIPGNLLLRRIANGFGGWWERAGLSVVLSLLIIMIGGLLLNTLHYIGLDRPLTTLNIFVMLSAVTALLVWLNRKERVVVTLPKLTYPSALYAVVAAVLTLLPLLAIGGAIRLNNGASNVLTMVMLALIGILFPTLLFCKSLKTLRVHALLMFATSLLLSTSLRGWYITGHDIIHEFKVFDATLTNNLWVAITGNHDPYNSCLSITILPTVLASISKISAPYIFKLIFQIIFSLVIIPIYYLTKKYAGDKLAYIATFIFISFPTFFNDMSFLNRQEIAFLFCALLFYISMSTLGKRAKNILSLSLLLGLVLSHYSTTYITLAILFMAWAGFKIFRYIFKQIQPNYISLLSLPILLITLLMTIGWYQFATQSSPNSMLNKIFSHNITDFSFLTSTKASAANYSLLSGIIGDEKSPEEVFYEYAGSSRQSVTYVESTRLNLTTFGQTLNKFIDVAKANTLVHNLSAKLYQLFMFIGLIAVTISLAKRRRAAINSDELFIYLLQIMFILWLVIVTVVPQASAAYGVARLFQESLFVTGLLIIYGLDKTLSFWKSSGKRMIITAVIFTGFFLSLSGFVPQITGGYTPQLALNNSGAYYEFYYTHKSDLLSTRWLESTHKNQLTYEDIYSAIQSDKVLTSVNLLKQDTSNGFIYRGYTNTTLNAYRTYPYGELDLYKDPNLTNGRDLLYANQDSAIYGEKEQ